jgi:hypothetical protein
MMRRLCLAGFAFLFLALPLRAGEPDGVQRAIDAGVAYLKSTQAFDGTWPYDQIGPTSLAGLTLLECGVPADDPAVVKAAAAVRQAALTTTQTYSLALSILFLDRLGEPADVFLIESMTVRLLAGQNNYGGWTYECPSISDSELRRLTTLLRQRNELVAAKDLPKAGVRRTENDLPKEIQQQLAQIKNMEAARGGFEHPDDNSNTQFAILGLWVAHRHGLPVGTALSRVNTRFRSSQGPDGGWGYKYYPTTSGRGVRAVSTATMTCSALLGLGVSQGYTNENKDVGKVKPKNDPMKDLVIRNGLFALGSCIDHPLSARKGRPRDIRLLDGGKGRQYYFLWSLERVAVAYGLKTIGGKDWYAWGCEILLASQERDGSWQAKFADAGCDTCFALLFLRRANLAKDLSAALTGAVQDPGEVVLKGAGVAGDNLAGIGIKPPEPGEKDDADSGQAGRAGGGKRVAGKPLPLPPQEAKPTIQEAKPPAEADAPPAGEPQTLGAELVQGSRQLQEQALEKLRDSKGSEYTQALADAIPKLDGALKGKAREALAARLSRMTTKTLGEKMDDDAPEVRRAAALACAMKDEKAHLRRLIELLEDKEPVVARAAYASLKSLTGRDFGPDANASRAEVRQAVSAWRDWWSKQDR